MRPRSRAFAAALWDPAAPPPAATRGRLGAAGLRAASAVYRNNVAVGLIGALEARYPVARRIVGPRRLPRAGARLRRCEQAALAGDDRLWRRLSRVSRGAARGVRPALSRRRRAARERVGRGLSRRGRSGCGLGDLAGLAGRALAGARIEFHPAARLLRFATPAASIWAAHQDDAEPAAADRWQGEDVLVTRPEADVVGRRPAARRLRLRQRGSQRGRDARRGRRSPADPDEFGTHLVGLVAAGAVASIVPGDRR